MCNNSLTKKNYYAESIIWGLIALIWYNNLFFKCLDGKTVTGSWIILLLMVAVSWLLHTKLAYNWRRCTFTIVSSLLIPLGIYAYITCAGMMPKLFRLIILATVFVIIISVCFIQISDFDSSENTNEKMYRTKKTYLTLRMVCTLASVVVMLSLFGKNYVSKWINRTEHTSTSEEDTCTIAANIDTVLLLQPEEWDKLDEDERLDVLRCIAGIERNYLGIEDEVSIYVKDMPENTCGYYKHSQSAIYISEERLMNDPPRETLDTLCHEMFHAAQHRYVEIYESLGTKDRESYFLYDASLYAQEFDDYKSCENGAEFEEYYGQKCEKDAREYAEEAVYDYYRRIKLYLSEQ